MRKLTSGESNHAVPFGLGDSLGRCPFHVESGATLRMFASPWSPPAWMKEPVDGETSMLISARPNGLAEKMQRPWAEYFSRRAGVCTLIASAAPLDCIRPR